MQTDATSVAYLTRSTCTAVMGYYSQLGSAISDQTRPHLPPLLQNAVETLYNTAPAMLPALFLPNFLSKLVIPGAALALNKHKVRQIVGDEVTNALYNSVYKAVLVNALFDATCRRGYWVIADVAFAAALYMK